MGIALTAGLWFDKLGAAPPSEKLAAFDAKFGVTKEDMSKLLEIALSKGGDFADLYFEYGVSSSVRMEEDILKSSSESVVLGCGVRVLNGEQTGYGYTEEMTFESIRNAALTAAAIAKSAGTPKINLDKTHKFKTVYETSNLLSDKDLETKIDLVKRSYEAAKNYDPKIAKVVSSMTDEFSYVTIANSAGLIVSDFRPQVRMMTISTAMQNGNSTMGFGNDGGRIGADHFKNVKTPEQIGKESAEEAIILLDAENAPTGEQTVVLSKDQSGVMIHEAVGHPLEADGVWKKTSIMTGKMGENVASPLITIYDDATIPNYRGSLNIDDEGVPTRNVNLIENGTLTGLLNDRLAAKALKVEPNGHGRRQSYRYPPIPRMNNTILAKGESDPQEIIENTKSGFYAVSYQGGMVDNTGKFTFSINLGYLIENGKLTKPLKNATLIGSNIKILRNVDMVGNDTAFFLGTCGKEGQSVPVTAGTPTLRISKMTVGGAA